MNFLANFPIELFEEYIESKPSTSIKSNISFDSDGNINEITDFRNNTLYSEVALNLNKGFPYNHELGFSIFKLFAEKVCPSLLKEPNGYKEIESIYKSANKSNIAKKAREKQGIKKDLDLLDSNGILDLVLDKPKWLIKDFIPLGGIVGFCADAGIGKTMVSLNLAISVASGRRFLNNYDVEQGSVVYVNQDMTFNEFQDRAKKFGLTRELPLYTFSKRGFSIEEYADEFIELVSEIKPLLVIFDTFRRIHSKNENSSQEMEEVMNFFMRLSDLGIAVLFPHHVTKGEPGYRGSTVIKGEVDLLIMLEKVKDSNNDLKLWYDKVRICEPILPKKLRLISKEDSLSFIEIHSDPNEQALQSSNKQKRTSTPEAKDFILRTLMSSVISGNPICKNEILEAGRKNGLNERRIETTLQELVRTGEVTSPKKGYYTISDGESDK